MTATRSVACVASLRVAAAAVALVVAAAPWLPCGALESRPGPLGTSLAMNDGIDPATVILKRSVCPIDIAERAQCGGAQPLCCISTTSVHCCPLQSDPAALSPMYRNSKAMQVALAGLNGTLTGCDFCMSPPVGYSLTTSNVVVGAITLLCVLSFGGIVASGIGERCAFLYEQHRLLMTLREERGIAQSVSAAQEAAVEQFFVELEETQEAELTEGETCVICCARRVDCVIVPCGHVVVCHFCADWLQQCPVCRAGCDRVVQVDAQVLAPLLTVSRMPKRPSDPGEAAAGDRPATADGVRVVFHETNPPRAAPPSRSNSNSSSSSSRRSTADSPARGPVAGAAAKRRHRRRERVHLTGRQWPPHHHIPSQQPIVLSPLSSPLALPSPPVSRSLSRLVSPTSTGNDLEPLVGGTA